MCMNTDTHIHEAMELKKAHSTGDPPALLFSEVMTLLLFTYVF
jgi:hypothetical protein